MTDCPEGECKKEAQTTRGFLLFTKNNGRLNYLDNYANKYQFIYCPDCGKDLREEK